MEIEQKGCRIIQTPDYAWSPHECSGRGDLVGNLFGEHHGRVQGASYRVEQRIAITLRISVASPIPVLTKSADAVPLTHLVFDQRKIATQGLAVPHQPQSLLPRLGHPWNPQLHLRA